MKIDTIRLGIVGAGNNTCQRHIPGFKAIEGVEIVSVCNRSIESSKRVAKEFDIPKVYDDWTELVRANDTDAICIGTWPNLHCVISLAALDVDKHVLTEARMAMNAAEARSMRDASITKPYLVTQVVPAPMTLQYDETIKELIDQGILGDILAVDIRGHDSSFVDKKSPIHWRQDQRLSGFNILNMGIWYEALMRWVGPATSVQAMTKVNVDLRMNAERRMQPVTVPDHVDVLASLECGAQAHLRFSSVMGHSRPSEFWIFGSDATIYKDMSDDKLWLGSREDGDLVEFEIPLEKRSMWRVEEDFINSIRGSEPVRLTSFDDGVRYMEFTEAVTKSAQTGHTIDLPI